MLLDRDVPVGDGELGQWGFHGQDSVAGQGRLDGLRVCALGQKELTVVLSVHRLCVRFLLVLGVNLKTIPQ